MVRGAKIDGAKIATQRGLSKGKFALNRSDVSFESSPLLLPFGCRIGFGNDVHRLVMRRKLILGGVRIAFDRGPMGHSDGDALSHAICDALLGAAALGDIGRHFPDTSPRWKGVSSLFFLGHVSRLVAESGFAILNVDSTIELEKPRLAPYIDRMRAKLARALGVRVEQVSVKAKSGEGISEVGRGEAVRAEAVTLIGRRQPEFSG